MIASLIPPHSRPTLRLPASQAYDSQLSKFHKTCPASALYKFVASPKESLWLPSAKDKAAGSQTQKHRAVLLIVDGLTYEKDASDYAAAMKLPEGVEGPAPALFVLQIRDSPTDLTAATELWNRYPGCAVVNALPPSHVLFPTR